MSADDLDVTETVDEEPVEDTSLDDAGAVEDESLDTDDTSGDLETSESEDHLGEAPAEEARRYAGKYESIEDLERGYQEAQSLLGQQSAYVQYGRMAAEDPNAFQDWYRSRSQGQAAPEPVVAFDPPVQYSPSLQDAITRYQMSFQSGQPHGLPAHVAKEVEQYLTYTGNKWNEWQQNPYSFAEQIAAPVVLDIVKRELIEPLKSQMWAASFQHQNQDVMGDPRTSEEFMSLVRAGNTPQAALELVRLRQQVAGAGRKEADVEARERVLSNRENDSRRHVKRKSSRQVDLSMESLEKKFAHLSGRDRGRAIAKAMGANLR